MLGSKIKVSFETPIPMLEESRQYNDFDYALVHLFRHPEYLRYYERALESGRTVYLDNSAFELGESFDPIEFFFWVQYLEKFTQNPSQLVVVVPDKMHDQKASVQMARIFLQTANLASSKVRLMFVVQGNSFAERLQCLLKYSTFIPEGSLVALNMTPTVYGAETVEGADKENKRIEMLDKILQLQDDGLIPKFKVHLLGCHDPFYFDYLRQSRYESLVESLDTSCPVVSGFEQKRLVKGKYEKSTTMFQDIVNKTVQPTSHSLILQNIQMVKNILTGETKSPYPGQEY